MPSVSSPTRPGFSRAVAFQSSTASTSSPASRSRVAIRSREPRVQAVTKARRFCLPAQSATWSRSIWNTVSRLPAGRLRANMMPGRPPASKPSAPSGRANGLKASTGRRASMAFQPARSTYSSPGGSGR